MPQNFCVRLVYSIYTEKDIIFSLSYGSLVDAMLLNTESYVAISWWRLYWFFPSYRKHISSTSKIFLCGTTRWKLSFRLVVSFWGFKFMLPMWSKFSSVLASQFNIEFWCFRFSMRVLHSNICLLFSIDSVWRRIWWMESFKSIFILLFYQNFTENWIKMPQTVTGWKFNKRNETENGIQIHRLTLEHFRN